MHKIKVGKLKTVSFRNRFKVSSYISSIDSAVRSDTKETLGTVISLVTSSHTPIFIFTKENEFFGLISPYQTLYSRKHPYTTKVSSIATKPPYITINTPLYDVASYMLESRVYVLPVFGDDREVKGIIHIKEVFQNILKDQDLLRYISSTIKPHAPVTSNSNASVGDIYQVMHEKGVSRVVLVDNKGNLAGIVSRNDLLRAFMKPTEKQRFGKNRFQQTDRAFDEEKEYRKDNPIKNYASDMVNTLPYNTRLEEIIKSLLSSRHNSIVLVDKLSRPVGFLSIHDVLVGLASLRPEEIINIIMSRPSNNVPESDVKEAEKLLTKFGQKMNKRIAIEKIEVHFEEPKYPTGGTAIFNTSIIVTPVAGARIVSKTKKRSFINSIQLATEEVEKQQERSGLTRGESQHTQV